MFDGNLGLIIFVPSNDSWADCAVFGILVYFYTQPTWQLNREKLFLEIMSHMCLSVFIFRDTY